MVTLIGIILVVVVLYLLFNDNDSSGPRFV